GIRDYKVTGVQTCALPIFGRVTFQKFFGVRGRPRAWVHDGSAHHAHYRGSNVARSGRLSRSIARARDQSMENNRAHCHENGFKEIGRASCRERVESEGGGG